jgi:hypothetical protein
VDSESLQKVVPNDLRNVVLCNLEDWLKKMLRGNLSAACTKHFQVKCGKHAIQHQNIPFKVNMEGAELKPANGKWFSFAERGTPTLTAYAHFANHFSPQFDQVITQDPEFHTMVFPFNVHGLFLL